MPASNPVFVAWTTRTGRARELADALGGQALGVFPAVLRAKPLVPLRYLFSGLISLIRLTMKRPSAVIVTHPPIPAPAFVGLWAIIFRVPFVIDAHPTAFGAKGHLSSRLTLPLHRWLARRAAGLIVASEPWAQIARSWGAKAIVVHEAPSFDLATPPTNEKPVVVFPGIFASDEPVEELFEAARLLADVELRVMGDTSRAAVGLVRSAPPNVVFTGWLDPDAYRSELERADLVIALTTEPGSVMRAACEAVFMGRPLVVSDSVELRAAFPYAIAVENSPESIAGGVKAAIDARELLFSVAQDARAERVRLWDSQLADLRSLLGISTI